MSKFDVIIFFDDDNGRNEVSVELETLFIVVVSGLLSNVTIVVPSLGIDETASTVEYLVELGTFSFVMDEVLDDDSLDVPLDVGKKSEWIVDGSVELMTVPAVIPLFAVTVEGKTVFVSV